VDLSPANVTLASDAARSAELVAQTRFRVGDADRLPVEDSGFDAVVCECAIARPALSFSFYCLIAMLPCPRRCPRMRHA